MGRLIDEDDIVEYGHGGSYSVNDMKRAEKDKKAKEKYARENTVIDVKQNVFYDLTISKTLNDTTLLSFRIDNNYHRLCSPFCPHYIKDCVYCNMFDAKLNMDDSFNAHRCNECLKEYV